MEKSSKTLIIIDCPIKYICMNHEVHEDKEDNTRDGTGIKRRNGYTIQYLKIMMIIIMCFIFVGIPTALLSIMKNL